MTFQTFLNALSCLDLMQKIKQNGKKSTFSSSFQVTLSQSFLPVEAKFYIFSLATFCYQSLFFFYSAEFVGQPFLCELWSIPRLNWSSSNFPQLRAPQSEPDQTDLLFQLSIDRPSRFQQEFISISRFSNLNKKWNPTCFLKIGLFCSWYRLYFVNSKLSFPLNLMRIFFCNFLNWLDQFNPLLEFENFQVLEWNSMLKAKSRDTLFPLKFKAGEDHLIMGWS